MIIKASKNVLNWLWTELCILIFNLIKVFEWNAFANSFLNKDIVAFWCLCMCNYSLWVLVTWSIIGCVRLVGNTGNVAGLGWKLSLMPMKA